jgi:hypothetical protein
MSESQLKENAAAVKKLFGTAAKLAQKQAALATLNNVTLPKIYHAIGKKIVGLDKLPPDLVAHRDKIRALEARIAARPEEPTTAPAEGFAAKAKQLAQQAAQKASKATGDAAASVRIQAAYVSLGKEAVDKYGDQSVPKDLAGEFFTTNATRATLQAEIASLRSVESIGFLSSRGLVIGVGICALLGVGYWLLPKGRPSAVPLPNLQPAGELSEGIATRTTARDQAAAPKLMDSRAAIARFESECDETCSALLSASLSGGSPLELVGALGEKLEKVGSGENRMDGTGIPPACAKAMISYIGVYGLLVAEAAGRSAGQEVPGGGIVAMLGSGSADADKSILESGNAAKYWTHVALIRSLILLNAESNAFHSDFKRQLMASGSQPAVFVVLQRMRRDIHNLLLPRYSACIEAGISKYGPPQFSNN